MGKLNKNIGALCYQDYKALIKKKVIYSETAIPSISIQPASIDLRLSKIAYEISASFLSSSNKVFIHLSPLVYVLIFDALYVALPLPL